MSLILNVTNDSNPFACIDRHVAHNTSFPYLGCRAYLQGVLRMHLSDARRGVCGDPHATVCSDELNAVAVGVALIFVCCAGFIARAPGRAVLATWLMASSMLRLLWGVPVVGDYFKSLSDVEHATTEFEWIYTRQVYVPVELGILNIGLYCIIRPYPPTAYAASAYWLTSIWLAVQFWDNAAAPLYTLHDVFGLFMGLLWFQAGPVSIKTIKNLDRAPQPLASASSSDDGIR